MFSSDRLRKQNNMIRREHKTSVLTNGVLEPRKTVRLVNVIYGHISSDRQDDGDDDDMTLVL